MKTKLSWKSHHGQFPFIELLIVSTIIGLLAAIAIPKSLQAQNTARLNINN